MYKTKQLLSNSLLKQFVRATQVAAIAAWHERGKGDSKLADKAAVDAMRTAFNQIDFSGEIVIGEGRKDESYEIPPGERVGTGKGVALDLAVDPLECTTNAAFQKPNATSVIAVGPRGSLYHCVDAYMEKIAVGPKAAHVIDLCAPVAINLKKIARALGKKISEITVAVLERPRHESLIKEILATGARIELSTDGDVSMAVRTCLPGSDVDVLMGIGASAEGVLAATAVKNLGGAMYIRWKPKDAVQESWLREAGIVDFNKVLSADDLAKGDSNYFIASGVIGGPLLRGVEVVARGLRVYAMVVSKKGVEYFTTDQ